MGSEGLDMVVVWFGSYSMVGDVVLGFDSRFQLLSLDVYVS